jgi:hypothetical protein
MRQNKLQTLFLIGILGFLILLTVYYFVQQFKPSEPFVYAQEADNINVKGCDVYFTSEPRKCDKGQLNYPPLYWKIKIKQLKKTIRNGKPTRQQSILLQYYNKILNEQENMPNNNCKVSLADFGQVYEKNQTPPDIGDSPTSQLLGTPNNWAYCYTYNPRTLPLDNSTITTTLDEDNNPVLVKYNGGDYQRIVFNDFNKENIVDYSCALYNEGDNPIPDGIVIDLNEDGNPVTAYMVLNNAKLDIENVDIEYAYRLFSQFYTVTSQMKGTNEILTAKPTNIAKNVFVGYLDPCNNHKWVMANNPINVLVKTTVQTKNTQVAPSDSFLGSYKIGNVKPLNDKESQFKVNLNNTNATIQQVTQQYNNVRNWLINWYGTWHYYNYVVIPNYNDEISRQRSRLR